MFKMCSVCTEFYFGFNFQLFKNFKNIVGIFNFIGVQLINNVNFRSTRQQFDNYYIKCAHYVQASYSLSLYAVINIIFTIFPMLYFHYHDLLITESFYLFIPPSPVSSIPMTDPYPPLLLWPLTVLVSVFISLFLVWCFFFLIQK